MAEVTYRSPGYFEAEIDQSGPTAGTVGTPAGLIGTSPMGPAFVPTTVTSLSEFVDIFGDAGNNRSPAYYAAQEYFKNGEALTFVRVLGAGGNATTGDILNTQTRGTTVGAGFAVSGSTAAPNDLRGKGCVQFIVARHDVETGDIDASYPIFSQNDSFPQLGSLGTVNLVRGVLLMASGTRAMILNENQTFSTSNASDDTATPGSTTREFKIAISSSSPGFGTADGSSCIRIYTASLDPDSDKYIAKILNTSHALFQTQEHLLYTHFPVDSTIANLDTAASSVGLASGSISTSATSGDSSLPFVRTFGRFDSRFQPARTTPFISQPFVDKEYELFHFETIGSGIDTSTKYKISISNIRKSDDPTNPYGTFTVVVRDFYDSDTNIRILEQFPLCDLNPASDRYVAKVIGDKKLYFNFDAATEGERRFISAGRYPNASRFVRVVMNSLVESGNVPATSLPFGFAGLPVLKTTDTLTDAGTPSETRRLTVRGIATDLTSSIVPPVPLVFKVTTGETEASPTFVGQAGYAERPDARLYWGIKFERVTSDLDPNGGGSRNEYIDNIVKFAGIQKLDALVTGSGANTFGSNKFSLARVALYNGSTSDLTGTADQHMINAFYGRNKTPAAPNYTVTFTGESPRITFASICALSSSYQFNRFSDYLKFTNVMYGGWDGTNILDADMASLNDKGSSQESGGKAISSPDIGLSVSDTSNVFGSGVTNSAINSYRGAINIITDPLSSRVNTVTIPGIRDPNITNYAMSKVRDYARALYVMDIPTYTDSGARIFDATVQPDVNYTIQQFAGRSIDNRYVATYFPDVNLVDSTSGRRVRVPASVAALSALAQNDRLAFPWYAPAGFNRASLTDVTGLATRLNSADRDSLYDARINPITSFPGAGFVIFGQKTLQISRSALDRVNVMRMLIELAGRVSKIGLQYAFEQNTASTRARFVSQLTPELTLIQSQSGIDSFSITMDETNNTQTDIEQNKLNGRIVIVPTRAVEYIAVDFVITNSGVEFV
jgi:hypothetical protein